MRLRIECLSEVLKLNTEKACFIHYHARGVLNSPQTPDNASELSLAKH